MLANHLLVVTREPKPLLHFSRLTWGVLVVAGIVLIALRTPAAWLHQGFYAEDGVIFFQQQLEFGWSAIFLPYAGYLQLVPRMAASISSVVPALAVPFLFAVCSAVIQSLAASYFFLPQNRFLVRSDTLRLAASLIALIDFPSHEMLNNIMAAQWYMVPVALLMLGEVGFSGQDIPRRRLILYCFLAALIALSSPILVVLLPVIVVLFFRTDGAKRVVPLAFCVALFIQAAVFLVTNRNPPQHGSAPGVSLVRLIVATVGSWFYRDLLSIALGERIMKFLAVPHGQFLAIALVAGILSVIFLIVKSWRPRDLLLLSCLAAISFGMIAAALFVRDLLKYFGDITTFSFFDVCQRYFCVSGWLTLVMTAMIIDRISPGSSDGRKSALFLAIFTLGVVTNFQGEVLPDKHWEIGAPKIERWKQQTRNHQPAQHVNISISPDGWGVDLPERK